MNPVKLNQSVLTLVGVCASEENTRLAKKIRNAFIHALLCIITGINTTTTSIYVIKYMSVDYSGAIYGLLATTAVSCQLFILLSLRYHSKKLRTIFSTLNDINDECKFHLDKQHLILSIHFKFGENMK